MSSLRKQVSLPPRNAISASNRSTLSRAFHPRRHVSASTCRRLPPSRAFASATFSSLRFRETSRTMASDDDYMAFLNKANQDPSEGQAKKTTAPQGFKTQDSGARVPKDITDIIKGGDRVYVSDADEPFVGVALKWDEGGKGLPDEVEFARLINHPDPENAGVELMDPIDWDSNGEYGDIIEAVRKAGKGNDVRVYRVARDGSRTEYYVVTTEGEGKDATLVGVKALSVET